MRKSKVYVKSVCRNYVTKTITSNHAPAKYMHRTKQSSVTLACTQWRIHPR